MICTPIRILDKSRVIVKAKSVARVVGIASDAPQSVETATQKKATLVSRAEGKYTFNATAYRATLEVHPFPRTQHTKSALSTRLESTTIVRIASILAFLENAVQISLWDVGRGAESIQNMKQTSMILEFICRAVRKAFWNTESTTMVEHLVHKCVKELRIVPAVATRTVDFQAFTVRVTKSVKIKTRKGSFKKAELCYLVKTAYERK